MRKCFNLSTLLCLFIVMSCAISCRHNSKDITVKTPDDKLNTDELVIALSNLGDEEETKEALKKRINDFEKAGHYKQARDLIINSLSSNFSMDMVDLLFELNSSLAIKLKCKNIKKEKTLFSPPEKDHILTTTGLNIISASGLSFFSMLSSAGVTAIRNRDIKRRMEIVSKMRIDLLSRDEIQDIAEKYDTIKDSHKKLNEILNKQIVNGALPNEIVIIKRMNDFKKGLKDARTDFISYNVISPYFFEVERYLFLANSDYLALKFKDKDALDNAVKILAQSCHKDWLYESNEDVRMQFIEVLRGLKQIANKNQLDDYKVLTTISDSNDPSKERGADAWFK